MAMNGQTALASIGLAVPGSKSVDAAPTNLLGESDEDKKRRLALAQQSKMGETALNAAQWGGAQSALSANQWGGEFSGLLSRFGL